MTGTTVALFLYLIAVTAIGIWSARRSSKNVSEFYLGGRGMNEFVVALSAVVSGRSAWLMMGMVGLTFAQWIAPL